MTKIMKELIVIKKTYKISSDLVFSWAKTVEAQRVQNVILATTKESRELMLKRQNKSLMTQVGPRNTKTSLYKDTKPVVQHMSLTDVWHLERTEENVGAITTSRGCAKATADWCWKRVAKLGEKSLRLFIAVTM